MFETLSSIGLFLSVYLFLVSLSEAIDLEERKSEERREAFRQAAYARTRRAATIKQNREQLWREIICK
ncbi:hypothetical protein [Ruminococcus sp.]|uniref:hypothetical protein n=1 Tax=Ruminococcus sp. TaxID=41978 RepID=UPI001B773A62|nr:hypothetical protein [Ruminococcus sp.]MBP5432124.1 hypothetical protein [Ruminococcus sp.]